MDSLFGLDRVSTHDDSLALLTTVSDSTQLLILESILRDAEIPYLVKHRGSGSSVKIITGFSLFAADIFVRREQLELATELIQPPENFEEFEEDAEEEHE